MTTGTSKSKLLLLGPAIVAGVAYIDPGNVATNLGAGSKFGYQLTWVIILANLMAWLVQYLSAKLGIVSGKSIPELLNSQIKSDKSRHLYLMQAIVVAMATDLAEVLGGAIALNLIFHLPLVIGGIITGAVTLFLITMYSDGYLRTFEFVIIALVLITGIGFTAGLFINPPNFQSALSGFKPMLSGDDGILLAVGIIGATIMPHAIYAHSALSRDRFRNQKSENFRYLIKVTRWDVSIAMLVAGAVNLGILFLGAENLHGVIIKDSIQGAYSAIGNSLGTVIATLFAVGLLASGLASSSVGTFAGGVIVSGLTTQQLPIWIRRSITLIPALLIIGLGTNPTQSLILSQVILSFGIPFALYPLVKLTSQESIMGELRNHSLTTLLAYVIMMFISALNAYLIILQIVRGLT